MRFSVRWRLSRLGEFVVLDFDLVNAFGSLEWDDIRAVFREELSSFLPWAPAAASSVFSPHDGLQMDEATDARNAS